MNWHNVILICAIILAPLASVRITNAIYRERKVPFLNTDVLIKKSIARKNKSAKWFLTWLANFCDCIWCVSYISSVFVIALFGFWITQLIIIMFGLSELTIIIGDKFHD